MSRTGEPASEIPDYERYDFSTVWKGRGIEDTVEKEIVSRWATGETGVDLGGGFGRITGAIEKRLGRTFLLDYSMSNLRRALSRLEKTTLVRASLERLPFDDGVFDFVALIRVMQHIHEPDSLLKEVVRVARDGATFVLGIANEENWGRHKDVVRVKVTRTGHRIYSTPLRRYRTPGLQMAEIRGAGAFDNVIGRRAERLWPLGALDLATSRLWPAKSMLFVRYRVRKGPVRNEPRVRCACGGAIQGRRCDRCGRSYGEIVDLVGS